MKAAIASFFVLFCLLLPSDGVSSDEKNVSTSTKVRFYVDHGLLAFWSCQEPIFLHVSNLFLGRE